VGFHEIFQFGKGVPQTKKFEQHCIRSLCKVAVKVVQIVQSR